MVANLMRRSVEKLKPDNMGAAKTYLRKLRIKGFGEKSVEKVLDYFWHSYFRNFTTGTS